MIDHYINGRPRDFCPTVPGGASLHDDADGEIGEAHDDQRLTGISTAAGAAAIGSGVKATGG